MTGRFVAGVDAGAGIINELSERLGARVSTWLTVKPGGGVGTGLTGRLTPYTTTPAATAAPNPATPSHPTATPHPQATSHQPQATTKEARR